MQNIEIESKTLIGDVLISRYVTSLYTIHTIYDGWMLTISIFYISSGIVAYLGQLSSYRTRQIREWILKCTSLGLLCSPYVNKYEIRYYIRIHKHRHTNMHISRHNAHHTIHCTASVCTVDFGLSFHLFALISIIVYFHLASFKLNTFFLTILK